MITYKLEEQTQETAIKLEDIRLRSYGIIPTPNDYDKYYIDNIINGSILVFTCYQDGKLISGCYVSNAFNSLYIDYLFVLPEYQQKGLHIGKQLLEYILANKKQIEEYFNQEFTESKLYATNDKTKKIYSKMGYTEDPTTELLCKKLGN